MTEQINTDTLFQEYGRAAFYAQLLEYDLLTIWILDSIRQGISFTRQDILDFQAAWEKRTLGNLLKPLQDSALIPEDMKEFLETIRRDRNKLIHNFFMSEEVCLEDAGGVTYAMNELRRIKQNLDMGRRFFRGLLESYSRQFGIDVEKNKAEVRDKLAKAEHTGAPER